MIKAIKQNQIVALAFLLPALTKFLILPSQIINFSGKYAYLVVLILFCLEALLAYFIFKMIEKAGKTSFFTLLKARCGVLITKVITIIFGLYFIIKALMLILDTNNLFNYSFYNNFSPYFFIFGLFVLLFYTVNLKLKTFARSFEVFVLPFAISITIVVVLSLMGANILNSLPIIEQGWLNMITSGFKSIFWFGDFIILFLFIGRVKIIKNFTKKATISYCASSLLVILFIFNFYNTYSVTTSTHTLAIADLLNMVSASSVLNKIDWLIVFIWSIVLIFGICFYAYVAATFLKQTVNKKYEKIVTFFSLILLIIMLLIINFNTNILVNFLTGNFFYVLLALQYILPIILIILLTKVLRRKKQSD